MAESSGGALVHAGVITEMSSTVFEGNDAGNEGPAVLSLGIVESMTDVAFQENGFFCPVGTYCREVSIVPVSYALLLTSREHGGTGVIQLADIKIY